MGLQGEARSKQHGWDQRVPWVLGSVSQLLTVRTLGYFHHFLHSQSPASRAFHRAEAQGVPRPGALGGLSGNPFALSGGSLRLQALALGASGAGECL